MDPPWMTDPVVGRELCSQALESTAEIAKNTKKETESALSVNSAFFVNDG